MASSLQSFGFSFYGFSSLSNDSLFWAFCFLFLYSLGTIVSARGCLRSSKTPTENTENDKFLNNSSEGNGSSSAVQSHDSDNVAKETPGMLESTMDIIYQISTGASVLTDLVFWCILVPMLAGKQFEVTLLIGLIHSLNAIFLAIDSLFNSLPFEWFGFAYFIIWSATYITFQLDSSRVWFHMVALSLLGSLNSSSASLISRIGFDPCSMLRCLLLVRESQKHNFLQVLRGSICDEIVVTCLISSSSNFCLSLHLFIILLHKERVLLQIKSPKSSLRMWKNFLN